MRLSYFIIILIFTSNFNILNANKNTLTKKEMDFLNKHQEFKCVSTNSWAPFNTSDNNGNLVGISVDFWKLLSTKIGLENNECQVIDSFSNVLHLIKTKKADLTISTAVTQEKKKYANFTDPYASFPIVIATRNNVGFISETKELNGKKIAVGRGFTSTSYLKNNYKEIDYVEVTNIEEGLLLLESGEVFGLVDVLPVVTYLINKNGHTNLKISGKTEFIFDIRIMIRDDYPELVSILSKEINFISQKRKDEILEKWFVVKEDDLINDELLIKLALLTLIILAAWLYRERLNKKYTLKLNALVTELEKTNLLLEKSSITDKLTGLYNRVKIDNSLQENISIFKRYGNPFSVILLDIDDFKKVNDEYGHLVGDNVLKEFSILLQKSIRSADILGRWGGEEFLIILPQTDDKSAFELANKLKDTLHQHTFSKVGNVNGSFGVSQIHFNDTMNDIVNRTDLALYHSKKKGKNTVTLYS